MQLPINARNTPFREKYLDETQVLAPWFVFGKWVDGRVDVADANGDIFTGISPEDAERIIKARDYFLGVVHGALAQK